MNIEVIKGKIGNHGTGEVIELDDKAAERLIKLGYAKKSDGKSEETKTPPPATPAQGGASTGTGTNGGSGKK